MSDEFISHLRDLFAAFGPISARKMFGGHGLYHDGVMIGVVFDDTLYLKTDAQCQARFEAAGSAPFIYTGQRKAITMSYWSLPIEAMDSPQAMLPWARLAHAAALRKANTLRLRPAQARAKGTAETVVDHSCGSTSCGACPGFRSGNCQSKCDNPRPRNKRGELADWMGL